MANNSDSTTSPTGSNPPVDPALVALLVCPEDKGPLVYLADEAVFYNPRLKRTYPVRDGIPVMLVEESTTVDDAEGRRLSALAG